MKPLIIFDHDIGTNPDDFFALLLLLNSPEISLELLISGNNYAKERAIFAQKILENANINTIQSLVGENTGCIDFFASQHITNYSPHIEENYVQKIKNILEKNGHIIWVVVQGLSNLAYFLRHNPKYIDTFDVLHMGITTKNADKYIGGGTNIEADPQAAKYVYELQLKRMRVVGAHTTLHDTIRVHPQTNLYKKLEHSTLKNHKMLFQHLQDYYIRRGIWPALHDPLTTTVAIGKDFVQFTKMKVSFDKNGKYRLGGDTNVLLSKDNIQNAEEFMKFITERI